MNRPGLLERELLSLLTALGPQAEWVIIGGGLGLNLKAGYIRSTRPRTILEGVVDPDWVDVRPTNDLDAFLAVELMADPDEVVSLRKSLTRLGYQPIEGAEYYQFKRPLAEKVGGLSEVKLDLLMGPPGAQKNKLKIDDRRARPKNGSKKSDEKLHAHPTPEAIGLESMSWEMPLAEGQSVRVPHALTFLLMKLHAFRDQLKKGNDLQDQAERRRAQGKAQTQALDVFRQVSLVTDFEYAELAGFHDEFGAHPSLISAQQIVNDHFAGPTPMGTVVARATGRFSLDANQSAECLKVLAELLGCND